MDIVLPLTHWKGCLQTINQFISLREGTFFFFSHYSSLFHFLSSSPKHLHYTTTPSSLLHPLSHWLLSYLLLSLSRTCVCSPSIIFNTAFPEQRCMPEMETKRLWYKPGCVGRASYLHVRFNQLVFCLEKHRIGAIKTIQLVAFDCQDVLVSLIHWFVSVTAY